MRGKTGLNPHQFHVLTVRNAIQKETGDISVTTEESWEKLEVCTLWRALEGSSSGVSLFRLHSSRE